TWASTSSSTSCPAERRRCPSLRSSRLWLVGLAGLAVALPLAEFAIVVALGRATPFNDFKDYYFGAKLVAAGRSPYDAPALVVLALFGFGMLLVMPGGRDAVAGGVAVGLAAVVKIVPAVVAVPLLMAGRRREAVALLVTIVAALAVSAELAPVAGAGTGRLVDLLGPDAYFTNQSINGFLSRLVLASDRSLPLVPGAFDPQLVGLVL